MGWVVAGTVVGALLLAGIIIYNRLIRAKVAVRNAWAQVDTQLQRRHDLIPNLVATVRGYADHERGVLDAVTEARASALTIHDPIDREVAEDHLGAAVARLLAVAEGYPDLIDGSRATFAFGPFSDREAATVSVHVPTDSFADARAVPVYDPVPLGQRGGWFDLHRWLAAPWPLDRVGGALVLLLLLAVPVLVWEKVSAWAVYRDRVTDPQLHDRQHPTALPAPPFGFRPPEVAGLQLKADDDQLFLANLVDLDQRGLIVTRTDTEEGRWFSKDKEVLTVTLGPGIEHAHPMDAEVVHALLPGGSPAVFDGTYEEAVAKRVNKAKTVLAGRRKTVFDTHGFKHDAGGVVAKTWFRVVMTGVYLLYAATAVGAVASATPLHPLAGGSVAVLVLMGWGLVAAVWQHHRLPLNSEGRDATAQARAFEEFVRTVEGDQIEWAAGQAGIDHHHPAISLLPYAIALGLADSWYDPFSSVMQELAVAAGGGAATGAATWWASPSAFRSVSSSQSGTSTAPSSSGGGGGGGSGGGGGGGGSW